MSENRVDGLELDFALEEVVPSTLLDLDEVIGSQAVDAGVADDGGLLADVTEVAIANSTFEIAEGSAESPSVLPLLLVRSGDLSGSSFIEVEPFAVGDRPVESADFVEGFDASRVSFLPGETAKTVEIAISPDGEAEGDETFGVRLATSGAEVLPDEDTFFTIVDGDAEQGTGFDVFESTVEDDVLIGGEGRDRFVFNRGGGVDTVVGFGGVGTGFRPEDFVTETIDRLEFSGEGFTAESLILRQNGADLEVAFEGIGDSVVVLQDFDLERIANLHLDGIGNILFDGQEFIEDNFDVIDADSTWPEAFNRNTVTFLNDLDNTFSGLDDSDDTINAQGGDDELFGLSGNDLLRGGAGNDRLSGGCGDDRFSFSTNRAFDRDDVGIDSILDFVLGEDRIVLSRSTFTALAAPSLEALSESEFAVVSSDDEAAASDALIVYSAGSSRLFYNQNGGELEFGSGGQFAVLSNLSDALSATDFQVVA